MFTRYFSIGMVAMLIPYIYCCIGIGKWQKIVTSKAEVKPTVQSEDDVILIYAWGVT